MSDLNPSLSDVADGMALWQEHKPQTGDDWLKIAVRCVNDSKYDPSDASPMFQALYAAVDAIMEYGDHTSWRCEHAPHFYLANPEDSEAIIEAGDCFCGLLAIWKRMGYQP